MAEEKEKTVQKSYRLPVGQVEFIELLAARQILGATRSAVVRTLLGTAIQDLIKNEFVKKHLETLELLRKK